MQSSQKRKRPNNVSKPPQFAWPDMPQGIDIPKDELEVRLDFYKDAVVLQSYENDLTSTRIVSPIDVARALQGNVPISTGLLPEDALAWFSAGDGPQVLLWRKPGVWKAALILEPMKPPVRFDLPMPGLIFQASPRREPWVWAVRTKSRPTSEGTQLYRAPLYNVFASGLTCPGNHRYPADIAEAPEQFFLSYFSLAGDHNGRSQKYPNDLKALWAEINGTADYPLDDLIDASATIKDVLAGKRSMW